MNERYERALETGRAAEADERRQALEVAARLRVQADLEKRERARGVTSDVYLGIGRGVIGAIEETFDALDSVDGWLNDNVADLSLHGMFGIGEAADESPFATVERGYRLINEAIPDTQTTPGAMTEVFSRFVTGFVGGMKGLNKIEKFKDVGKVGQWVKGMVAGGIADFTVFDAHEERLSNFLIEFDSPLLNNDVTQFLAADENDGELEGRMKSVLEGGGLGALIEPFFMGLRALRSARKAKAEKNRRIRGFHGTAAEFDEFDMDASQFAGVHFTDSEDLAQTYANVHGGGSPRVIEAELDIHNPIELTDFQQDRALEAAREIDSRGLTADASTTLESRIKNAGEGFEEGIDKRQAQNRELRAWLLENGYDSIKYAVDDAGPKSTAYVVLDPSRIRQIRPEPIVTADDFGFEPASVRHAGLPIEGEDFIINTNRDEAGEVIIEALSVDGEPICRWQLKTDPVWQFKIDPPPS